MPREIYDGCCLNLCHARQWTMFAATIWIWFTNWVGLYWYVINAFREEDNPKNLYCANLKFIFFQMLFECNLIFNF